MTAAANTADQGRRENEEQTLLDALARTNPGLRRMSSAELAQFLEQMLNTREAAEFLTCGVSTLAKLRAHASNGPIYLKVGGGASVRYRRKDLLIWLAQRQRHSTSEYPTAPGTGRPRKHA